MLIINKKTGEIFEITGSVNKIVQYHSYINSSGVTATIQLDEGSIENDTFAVIAGG